jgi:hypothetical protein
LLQGEHSAVDGDDVAGDEAGTVLGQEDGHLGDLGGLRCALEWEDRAVLLDRLAERSDTLPNKLAMTCRLPMPL